MARADTQLRSGAPGAGSGRVRGREVHYLPAGNFAGIVFGSARREAIRVSLCGDGSKTWSEFPAVDGQ